METEEKADTYREYPICRTCLNVIRSKSYRLQENSGFGDGLKISHILRYIVPELYLGLSHSPEICGNCRESLRVAYTFRKLCLETETMIGNYLKNVRCTAQVIDLGAVINYLSKKKVRQTAQRIISEWEDDSSEDLPTTSETPSSKKIPISDLESLKHAVKQLSQKSVKPNEKEEIGTTEKIHSILEPSHTEPVKDNIDPLDARTEVTTLISEGAFSKTDRLKFDAKTGFFLNSSGKKFIVRNDKAFLIDESQDITLADQTKNVESHTYSGPAEKYKKAVMNKLAMFGQTNLPKTTKPIVEIPERTDTPDSDPFSIPDSDNASLGEFEPTVSLKPNISPEPNVSREANVSPEPNVLREPNVSHEPNVSSEPTVSSEPAVSTEPNVLTSKRQQVLTVCEETGLLKNSQGEFFNFDGTPMNNEQVEAEKSKAIIRGETLFKISNICTVTDAAFESGEQSFQMDKIDQEEAIPVNMIDKTLAKTDQEEEIPVNLIEKETDLTKSSQKRQFHTTRVTQYVGSISVKKTSDLQNPVAETTDTDVEASQQTPYLPILPRLLKNPAHKTYERSFFSTKDITPPLIPLSSKQSLVLNPLVKYGSHAGSHLDAQPKQKPKTNILNFLMNKSLGLPEMPMMQFNMDSKVTHTPQPDRPQATKRFSIISKKVVDPSFQTPTIDSLVNLSSNDSFENFVRIKDEPLDFDLDNPLAPDSEDTLSAPDIEEELGSWQNIINSLEDTNSNYVDVPEFVKINNVNMLDMERLHEEHYSNKNPDQNDINNSQNVFDNMVVRKLPETREEPVLRESVLREPVLREPINAVTDKALWASLPERFPYNGKMLVKCGNFYKFEEEKVPKRRRRIKMVPVSSTPAPPLPQQEEIPAEQEDYQPDREICVLFTNYSPDGSYINDHDYLVAPYIRNKLIVHEEKNNYCVCFICGLKHRMHNHAEHMTIHSSTCPVCNMDVRTPYMLNLHMKSHAKQCKICLGVVPYVNIAKHKKNHYKGGVCDKDSIFQLEEYDDDEDEEEARNEVFVENNRLVKTCFVPSCRNSSKNSSKIFIYIPKKNHINWFKFVGRKMVPIKQNLFWCCEDHFDMEDDFKNWEEFKLMNVRLRIKQGVLPHKFIDTPSTIDKHHSQLDNASKKRQEKNKRYNLEKAVLLEDRIIAETEFDENSKKDKLMHSRLSTRTLPNKNNDPVQTKSTPSTVASFTTKPKSDESTETFNTKPESDESVKKTRRTNIRRSLRNRSEKSPNQTKKDKDVSSDKITPTSKIRKLKTETEELTDTNETISEEIDNSSFEKSTEKPEIEKSEKSEVEKSENENKHVKEPTRRGRKRISREVECPNVEELSNKRVLRTRAKKPTEVNKNESHL